MTSKRDKPSASIQASIYEKNLLLGADERGLWAADAVLALVRHRAAHAAPRAALPRAIGPDGSVRNFLGSIYGLTKVKEPLDGCPPCADQLLAVVGALLLEANERSEFMLLCRKLEKLTWEAKLLKLPPPPW